MLDKARKEHFLEVIDNAVNAYEDSDIWQSEALLAFGELRSFFDGLGTESPVGPDWDLIVERAEYVVSNAIEDSVGDRQSGASLIQLCGEYIGVAKAMRGPVEPTIFAEVVE